MISKFQVQEQEQFDIASCKIIILDYMKTRALEIILLSR